MDDFKPVYQGTQPTQAPPQQQMELVSANVEVMGGPLPMELQANLELAKVTQDGAVMAVIQRGAQLQQFLQFKRIENQAQYDQAIDAFNAAKEAVQQCEALRHQSVDFQTKVVALKNAFFKTIRDGIERSKQHLGQLIDVKKQADLAVAKARAEEAARLLNESGAGVNGVPIVQQDGVGVVQMQPPPVEVPGNVVSSARGAKVHTRTDTEFEVIDLVKFLKVCVSAGERNKWLSDHVGEFIEVKVSVVKKLAAENKKRKIDGVRIEQVTKTV